MPRETDHAMGRYLQHLARVWLRENGAGDDLGEQKALAERIGVSPAHVTEIVSHGTGAGGKTQRGFAKLRGIEPWELAKESAEWNAANPIAEAPAPRLRETFARLAARYPDEITSSDVEAAAAAAERGELGDMPDAVALRYLRGIALANEAARSSSPRAQAAALASPIADERTVELDPAEPIASPSAPARDDAPSSETSITLQAARILPQNTGTPPYEIRRLDVSEVRALAVHEATFEPAREVETDRAEELRERVARVVVALPKRMRPSLERASEFVASYAAKGFRGDDEALLAAFAAFVAGPSKVAEREKPEPDVKTKRPRKR